MKSERNCKNSVFIAVSMDGYIADADGGIEWLDTIPEINTIDSGYMSFIAEVDALVMGRGTFEKVCSFDIEWPYTVPVYVISYSLSEVPEDLIGKVHLMNGIISDILSEIHALGHTRLYIDGGSIIQSFLKEDMIDEMIITTIPILIGGGISLFGNLDSSLRFNCVRTTLFLDSIVQNKYIRLRNKK